MSDITERDALDLATPQLQVDAGAVAVRETAPSPAIAEGPGSLLSAIVQMARDPSVDVQKLHAILEMQERMEARQAKTEFDRAYVAMTAELPRVKKNGTIEMPKKDGTIGIISFAKWEDMDAVIRPILKQHRFALRFTSEQRPGEGGGLIVTCHLVHDNGHSISASMPLPLDTGAGRSNIQAGGSTIQYGKRYTCEMVLNLVREGVDNDGARVKFISDAQADELRAMAKEAGRQEGPLLDHLFGGAIRSFDEVEVAAFVVVKNLLDGIIRKKRGPSSE